MATEDRLEEIKQNNKWERSTCGNDSNKYMLIGPLEYDWLITQVESLHLQLDGAKETVDLQGKEIEGLRVDYSALRDMYEILQGDKASAIRGSKAWQERAEKLEGELTPLRLSLILVLCLFVLGLVIAGVVDDGEYGKPITFKEYRGY